MSAIEIVNMLTTLLAAIMALRAVTHAIHARKAADAAHEHSHAAHLELGAMRRDLDTAIAALPRKRTKRAKPTDPGVA